MKDVQKNSLKKLGFLAIGVLLLILTIYSLSGGSGVKEAGPYAQIISKVSLYFIGFAVVFGLIIYALTKVMSIPSTVEQIISIINFLLFMGLIALILSIFNFNTSESLVISGNTGLGFIFSFILNVYNGDPKFAASIACHSRNKVHNRWCIASASFTLTHGMRSW